MPAPRVSVVIPTHNSEPWLEATLLSIQNQSLPAASIEIIVVDNASNDGSIQLAESILAAGQSPFQIIRLESNSGPSRARNVGWQVATAPWIQFLDSDDLLAPEKIAHQLAFVSNASPQVAVIYSEWQNYGFDDGEWKAALPVKDPALGADVVRSLLETENFLATGSHLIRKPWLERVGGFDENCWLIEDVHLLLRLAIKGGEFLRAAAGRALFFYRRRVNASLSATRQAEFLNGCARNYRLAEDHWRSRGELTPTRLQFLTAGYEPLLHSLIEADRASFENLLRHLRSINPGWKPAYDTRIRILSSVVGYPQAAQLALNYRRWKRKLSHTFSPACF